MSNLCIATSRTATVGAAVFASAFGYIGAGTQHAAVEQARGRNMSFMPRAIAIFHGTASRVNSSVTSLKPTYILQGQLSATTVRNVTRMEDLILRRATLRAGRLVSKGRLVQR